MSEHVINLSLPDLFIRFDNVIADKYASEGMYSFFIPNTAKPGVKMTNKIPVYHEIKLNTIEYFNSLQVRLTDSYGKEVNLNGHEYIIELRFEN